MQPLPGAFPIGRDPASVRQRVTAIEKLLERSFTIPGTRQTVGLDALIGLIPVGGDVIAAAMGLYMIWEARNIGMSRGAMVRMVGNVGFDWLIGLIPGVGDVADFFYRSNSRNLKIIKRHLDKHHPATATVDR
jgi:hypothetical protein